MKKITKLSILLATLALASSCQDEARLDQSEQFQTVTITAEASQTKTLLDDGTVKWESGDAISLAFAHPSQGIVHKTFSTSGNPASSSASFTGSLPLELTREGNGYNDLVRAVYPAAAFTANGQVDFTLPSEQRVREDGTFKTGLNLTSSDVSIADIRDDGNASATFLNAMSIIRFTLSSDITSVTLTGTAPLAGKAPLEFDGDGRLVVDGDGQWTDESYSVTLLPAEGESNFTDEQEVNLLVWPGSHTEITATLNTKSLGDVSKTSTQSFAFNPSKYYTLDFNVDTETLVNKLDGRISGIEGDIASLEQRLEALETNAEKVRFLLDQIQSVSLMTEYLDNSVYAYFAQQSVGMMKMDISLTYMVRPAAAMELLLDICKKEGTLSQVLSMQCDDKAGNLSKMTVKDAMLDGDILTVIVGAEQFDRSFYDGNVKTSMALQVSDGNTDILSDFANLIPKHGTILNIARTDDIPVLKDASFSMPYQYGAEDYSKCQVSIQSTGFSTAPTISSNSGTGYISASFRESDNLAAMSIIVTLKYDGNVVDTKTLTFADGGRFSVSTPASVDYIGGEVSVDVTENSFGSYTMQLSGSGVGDWIYETQTGVSGRYSLNKNDGSQRSVNVVLTITNGSFTYSKTVSITQKAAGTSLAGSYYYNGEKVLLNQKTASCANALNIVILGDGYQKKDLLKGGKFERSARSAMDSFFGIEPFKSFKDRFNVYMVAYESTDEGVDIKSSSISKNTYFNTYCEGGGNTAAYADDSGVETIKNVVKSTVGSSDAQYYRTIAIVLANTNEQAGSCGYPYRELYGNTSTLGEGWASFSICVLAANSTGTNGLVKHEAGGHAFGRLADEYYTGGTITSAQISELANWHNKGWYRNVCTDRSYWNLFIGKTGYEDVGYYEGAWGYSAGIYRPTVGGMMQNNSGEFNAPSRRAIYHRIIRQTEGYCSDSVADAKFFEYDKKNL